MMTLAGVTAVAVALLLGFLALITALAVSSFRRGLRGRREPLISAGRHALTSAAARVLAAEPFGSAPADGTAKIRIPAASANGTAEIRVPAAGDDGTAEIGAPAAGDDATTVAPAVVAPAVLALRRDEQIEIFLEIAPAVSGDSLRAVRAVAEAAGLATHARAQLRSRRWERRLAAARLLSAIGVEITAEDLVLFHDHRAVVRAQAALWAVTSGDPRVIDELVALLADPDGRCRFAAKDTLVRIGTRATAALSRLLRSEDQAAVTTALEVAAAVGHPDYVEPASQIARTGSPPQRALAASVLGACGEPSAVAVLRALLRDPEPPVRAAATVAIGELGDWPAAAAVAELLADPEWRVRRQAGLTLLRLSAPGVVLLRDAARAEDPTVVDIATRALQIAEFTTAPHRSAA